VFVYTTWLIDTKPAYAAYYLDYVKKYSLVTSGVFRSVLPDNPIRVKNLLAYESIASKESYNTFSNSTAAKSSSSDKVMLTMSMHNEDNASSVIAIAMMMELGGMPIEILRQFGESGEKAIDNIENLRDRCEDPEIRDRLELAEQIIPGIKTEIGEIDDAAE
jgi:hypothetical protein